MVYDTKSEPKGEVWTLVNNISSMVTNAPRLGNMLLIGEPGWGERYKGGNLYGNTLYFASNFTVKLKPL